ncbi:MAG: hypothetical protein M3Q89_06170 [Verrucomicrobiota bacterium]|nr:hypothetical protein [Verrucomicrobiota bacterium]
MNLPISSAEAEQSLHSIEASRLAIRRAIRAHRGHFHLWIWGAIWIGMALAVHFQGARGERLLPVFVLVGSAASTAIGFYQSHQLRSRIDKRFLAALGCLFAYGLLWPAVLGGFGGSEPNIRAFAFFALLVMQAYVLAGIWFDNYLLAIGLGVSALILIGLIVFPAFFWIWFAIFCGGPVFLSGFIVRYLWH